MSAMTMPQRTARILLRKGHANHASTAAKNESNGVLEELINIIPIEPQKPNTPVILDFLLCHNHQNRGMSATPKTPAKIGCAKAPVARIEPSRVPGTIDSTPK